MSGEIVMRKRQGQEHPERWEGTGQQTEAKGKTRSLS